METIVPLPEATAECFRDALASGEFGRCLAASLAAPEIGLPALSVAEHLLAQPGSVELTRMWALLTAQRFDTTAPERVCGMALSALHDRSPSVRCAALSTLGIVKAPRSVMAIVPLLADTSEDPHAWWEPASVAETAKEALRAIGTPEALAALSAA